jgi:sarcosine oxidase subunit alpha
MHVLRAEKGYPIVGQDTDGTVTPFDLGMGWIVNEAKGDFIGRRSLRRPDAARADRRHLVALLPIDPRARLPEGAQVASEPSGDPPVRMIGHVTSSYDSPVLERAFALGLIERGRDLVGRTVFARLDGGAVAVTVAHPVLYDPEARRRDG